MSQAKDEIGNFSIATRFGQGKRIYHDEKLPRPKTRGDAIRQIEEAFRFNRWDASDIARNARLCGLEAKCPADYTNDELKMILDDFEHYGMIIYEK